MALRFGTSGVRGLVTELTDQECKRFTKAFVRFARDHWRFSRVALAGDLRASTPRIMRAVATALREEDLEVVNCGTIPTPALCYFGMQEGIPSIMVTGSHIPEDRNGIKFNRPDGEVLKEDEKVILDLYATIEDEGTVDPNALPEASAEPLERYRSRYLAAFPPNCLEGLRIGVYQHSTVARDLLVELLRELGAEIVPLARSERFIAVDTEAVEDLTPFQNWLHRHRLQAIVSADGDADRPLIVDDQGRQLRGDVLGVLTARHLGAEAVATPVSCNTVVDRCGWFAKVVRTRIGSPYVIAGLQGLVAEGFRRVVGFEANGGFLTATELQSFAAREVLAPLPTRDAVLPILTVLEAACRQGLALSALRESLPRRFTWSGLLRHFPSDLGQSLVAALAQAGTERFNELLGDALGKAVELDTTDGARFTLESGEIVHFRPSGNAPEFRCYTEADSEERAQELNRLALKLVEERLRPLVESGA
ncbi:MAG: phosphomannomutase [Acidobacteriota bacterium]